MKKASKLWRSLLQADLGIGRFIYSVRASGFAQGALTAALVVVIISLCLWLVVGFAQFVLWLLGAGLQIIALGMVSAIALTFGVTFSLQQIYSALLLWLGALLILTVSIRVLRVAWYIPRPRPLRSATMYFRPEQIQPPLMREHDAD